MKLGRSQFTYFCHAGPEVHVFSDLRPRVHRRPSRYRSSREGHVGKPGGDGGLVNTAPLKGLSNNPCSMMAMVCSKTLSSLT